MGKMKITKIDSQVGQVTLYELSFGKSRVIISSYGAGIVDYVYKGVNLIQRPESIEDYLISKAYYGKTVGRTSGRLFPPDFKIDDLTYEIDASPDDDAHLHGGNEGFSFKHFEFNEFNQNSKTKMLYLKYVSKDGEEKYPGELKLYVLYEFHKDGTLVIKHFATSSKDTLCNITNHIYFNFNQNKNNIDHLHAKINGHEYVKTDKKYFPLSVEETEDTPFDLQEMTNLKDGVDALIKAGQMGYDHAYLINRKNLDENQSDLELYDDESNIGMNIWTDYPAIVLYSHNYPEKDKLFDCETNGVHGSLAVECQYEPSGIYHKDLHHAILRKDKMYEHQIIFKPYKK